MCTEGSGARGACHTDPHGCRGRGQRQQCCDMQGMGSLVCGVCEEQHSVQSGGLEMLGTCRQPRDHGRHMWSDSAATNGGEQDLWDMQPTFKYLIPDYVEDYAFNLRRWVVDSLRIVRDVHVETEEELAIRQRFEGLVRLYGPEVFPPDLVAFFNMGVGQFATRVDGAADEHHVQSRAYSLLYKHILKVEDKPIVTRFWLFASCVYTLLRMNVMQIPMDIFSTRVATRTDNQKRITRVKDYLSDAGTGGGIACCCSRVAGRHARHQHNLTDTQR